jgi:hypothetical protein
VIVVRRHRAGIIGAVNHERRRFERIPVHEVVLVELAPGDIRLTTCGDLSPGGAFVERVAASVGQRVIVHLHGGDTDWSAALHAIVRWTSDAGAGVEFRDMDEPSTTALANALTRARRPSHARQRTVMRAIKQG